VELVQALRAATAEWHGRIERLPLAVAMSEGRVSRDAYLALLGELLPIHRAVEQGLAAWPEAGAVYRTDMARAALLVRDRTILAAADPEAEGTLASELVTLLENSATGGPSTLIGALYVLEGSRLGSMLLAKPLARALGVPLAPGCGLDYHLEGLPHRPRLWQEFKAALTALPLSAAARQEVVRGGAAVMRGLHDLYAALSFHPLPGAA
jgi:heme oxygenase